MTRLTRFISELQLDMKGILWFSLLLTLFRGIFIFIFRDQLPAGISLHELGFTMWLGFRMSLKTAGFIVAIPFVLVTLVSIIKPSGGDILFFSAHSTVDLRYWHRRAYAAVLWTNSVL